MRTAWEQIKLANAGRRMYARLCRRCKIAITQEFARDYREQRQAQMTAQETVERTRNVLCDKCQAVYDEALGNR